MNYASEAVFKKLRINKKIFKQSTFTVNKLMKRKSISPKSALMDAKTWSDMQEKIVSKKNDKLFFRGSKFLKNQPYVEIIKISYWWWTQGKMDTINYKITAIKLEEGKAFRGKIILLHCSREKILIERDPFLPML